jgi:hypothetical protein
MVFSHRPDDGSLRQKGSLITCRNYVLVVTVLLIRVKYTFECTKS